MTPDLDALRAEIVELARAELHLDGPLPDGDLAESLDSMQRLSLVVAIEDRYQIAFEPEDDESARTLEDVARLVHARLLQQQQDPSPAPPDADAP